MSTDRIFYPARFRHLLEMDPDEIVKPDAVYVEYAACVLETNACGWHGWTLSFARVGSLEQRRLLPADTEQKCPRCGRGMYRLSGEQYDRSDNPDPAPKVHIVETEVEFVDDPDLQLAHEYAGIELEQTAWARDGHAHCEVCSDRISSDPYENPIAYAYKQGSCWICPHCYERIQSARRRVEGRE